MFDAVAERIEPVIVDQAAEIMPAITGVEFPSLGSQVLVTCDNRVEIEHFVRAVMAAEIL